MLKQLHLYAVLYCIIIYNVYTCHVCVSSTVTISLSISFAPQTLNYRVQYSPTNDSGEAGTEGGSTAPTYNQPPQASTISPPDYRDALQDVLVTSGGPTIDSASQVQ